jgi:hypothetical protein
MKRLFSFLIFIQFILIFFLGSKVGAEEPSCSASLYSLQGRVEAVQGQGGIWGRFSQSYDMKGHAKVTLTIDSKLRRLMGSLNHLCDTRNGIPFGEIARLIVPMLKEDGEEEFMKKMYHIGHSQEECEKLVEYARFSEKNLNRKLVINGIMKVIKDSGAYVEKYVGLSDNMGKSEGRVILEKAKTLISELEKFQTTDPFLVQAHSETMEIPHARFITGNSDAM